MDPLEQWEQTRPATLYDPALDRLPPEIVARLRGFGETVGETVAQTVDPAVGELEARRVRRAIETLGGNGTIEDFSPLPRLYRGPIVFESWEGTHNVLCLQVLRDLRRLDAIDLVLAG